MHPDQGTREVSVASEYQDKPSLNEDQIRQLTGYAIKLEDHYRDRGIIIEEVAGGFQFRSHPSNAVVIRHVFKIKPMRLSRAALETLAIVAYRQPLTRIEVEEIRGVDCGGVLKFLFEKDLVRVLGRREGPGRPERRRRQALVRGEGADASRVHR